MVITKRRRACCLALSAILLLGISPFAMAEEEGEGESYQTPSQITDEEIAEVLDAMYESGGAAGLYSSSSIHTETGIITFSGSDRYETSALEACYAYDTSEYVIIASGENFADALCAVALAGALECPILLTPVRSLSSYTSEALEDLEVSNIIIVGGTSSVSTSVATSLGSYGTVDRLSGADRFATQIAIYQYGAERDMWNSGYAIVANGYSFADTLSSAPLSYSLAAPIFITDSNGDLSEETLSTMVNDGSLGSIVAMGGTNSISTQAFGALQAVALSAGGGFSDVVRLGGEDRYATSAVFATWAVENGLLQWNGAGYTTGASPWDALGASAVQGVTGSVLLLATETKLDCVYQIPQTGIDTVRFFGGLNTISQDLRDMVTNRVGLTTKIDSNTSVIYKIFAISISKMADLEVENNSNYDRDEILRLLDAAQISSSDSEFYQFAVLNDGYSGMTAEQINQFISYMCTSSEASYGVSSKMRGTGAYFVAAARTYNINEVYLVCHAALESAWGCSTLSQGYVYDGSTPDSDGNYYSAGTYYNFFGIGAYDSSPLSGGRLLAMRNGWNSVQAAIMGGAQWISSNYINSSTYDQNTLYKMKWNVAQAVSSGTVWHQYATSTTWATGIANIMDRFYSFVGIGREGTGLTFEVPQYS